MYRNRFLKDIAFFDSCIVISIRIKMRIDKNYLENKEKA